MEVSDKPYPLSTKVLDSISISAIGTLTPIILLEEISTLTDSLTDKAAFWTAKSPIIIWASVSAA